MEVQLSKALQALENERICRAKSADARDSLSAEPFRHQLHVSQIQVRAAERELLAIRRPEKIADQFDNFATIPKCMLLLQAEFIGDEL